MLPVPPIAGGLLLWALAIKALLDGKIVWRLGFTWSRENDPKAFWRFVVFLVIAGCVAIAFAVLTRNIPSKSAQVSEPAQQIKAAT